MRTREEPVLDNINQKILARQIEVIYRLYYVGLIATSINAIAIVALHWYLVPKALLVTWLSVVLLYALLRLLGPYYYKLDTNRSEHNRKWKTRAVASLFISGLFWGVSAFFMLYHDAVTHQVAVALIICGMCGGAAATLSSLKEAYYGFFFPAMIPLIVFFLISANFVFMALGLIMIIYSVLISYSAETNHRVLKSNFELVLKNEDLISFLRDTNKKARSEISRRQELEKQLLASRENLEETVKMRTSQLLNSNKELQEQMSKRISAEQALRRSEELYRSMIETAQEGVWIIDDSHRINYINTRAAEILGYSSSEIQGRDLCDFLDSSQRKFHGTERRSRGVRQRTLFRKDGSSVTVLESQSTMPDISGGRKLTLGMITDITERQQWEKAVVNLNRKLQESNSELTEFSHSVSHDLRSPLGAIIGFSELLEKQYGGALGEEGGKYLSFVSSSARRMNELIRDLLSLSQVSRTEISKTEVNLSVMASEIISTFAARDTQRKVNVSITEDMIAFCDAGLIRIALENLLGNAWKYTSRNDNASIIFGKENRDGKTIFYISDNGVGFNMALQDRLFQPFKRLHPSSEFPGTGIGLATVHRIISRHGGDIWALSQPDKGASFYFTL